MIKMHGFTENDDKPCKYKWVKNSMSVFLILYMNKIFLIGNDILYIIGNKGFAIIIVLHKELRKSISHPRDEDIWR